MTVIDSVECENVSLILCVLIGDLRGFFLCDWRLLVLKLDGSKFDNFVTGS